MTVSVVLSSSGMGPPTPLMKNSERVRPMLSRQTRTLFWWTTRMPSARSVTVSLVPSAEYGMPVTSLTDSGVPRALGTKVTAGQLGTRMLSARANPQSRTSAMAAALVNGELRNIGFLPGGDDALDTHGAIVGDDDVHPVAFAGLRRGFRHRHERAARRELHGHLQRVRIRRPHGRRRVRDHALRRIQGTWWQQGYGHRAPAL